jgi:hypothetical protein
MKNHKNRLPVFEVGRPDYKKAFVIVILLMLPAFHVWPSMAAADHHEKRESHYKSEKKHSEYDDRKGQVKKEDEGNEAAG